MARFRLHIAFEIGVILKGLNGLLELIGGLLLLVFPPSTIQRFVVGLTHNELSKDPNDFIATHLRATAEHLSVSAQLFAALFLLLHGVKERREQLGADGEMFGRRTQVRRDEVVRVLAELVVRQANDEPLDRAWREDQQEKAADQLEEAVQPLEDDTDFEGDVEPEARHGLLSPLPAQPCTTPQLVLIEAPPHPSKRSSASVTRWRTRHYVIWPPNCLRRRVSRTSDL